MKIIKLILLLTIGIWAEFKLDISNKIDISQLENIVKNGWNDSNDTLNYLIISNAEKVMPEILKRIKKPVLKGVVTKDDSFPMPRILLNRDDYYFILSYCKYLEFSKNIEGALNLYLKSLKGLNSIVDKSMLSAIFHLSIEKLIVLSLKENQKYLKNLDKASLKKELILNTNILKDVLETERKMMFQILLLDETLPKNIPVLIDKYNKDYSKTYMEIGNKKELIEFERKINEVKKKIQIAYKNWIEKNIIPDIDRDTLVASYIFIMGLPRFRLIEDNWENIERNKEFLNSLP